MKMSCCSNKWAWLASGLLLMLVHYAMASRYVNVQGGSQKVTECGGYINGTRGFIKTPNFPRRFPTPISCRWLLFAPPSHKLILYFTQYYMRESFQVTVFDYYQDDRHYRGRHELGEISFEDEVTQYTVYKSYLLLEFQVEEIGNIHLRVDDFLLDVYGFNITYEVVPVNEPPRQDACSVYKCSFLGSCMATANFETYKCHCFGPYFGDECQYGPYCDPENGLNMCYNNGKCRYFFGSMLNSCDCPPGFTGRQCEHEQIGYVDNACEHMGCEQNCVEENGTHRCTCDEEHRLGDDNKTCVEKGRIRFHTVLRGLPQAAGQGHTPGPDRRGELCPHFGEEFLTKVTALMKPFLNEFQNLTLVNVSYLEGSDDGPGFWYVDFYFIGEKTDRLGVRGLLENLLSMTICSFSFDSEYLVTDALPALHSLQLSNHDQKLVYEDKMLTLVCKVKGSDHLQFRWLKDGAAIDVHRAQRNVWETLIPSSDGETRMSVLNIDKCDRLDSGIFTCIVTDWGEVRQRDIEVEIVPRPFVEVRPLAASVREGSSITLDCLSRDDVYRDERAFTYEWYMADKRISSDSETTGGNDELSEDRHPVGRLINIRHAVSSQIYTCVVSYEGGRVRESCNITVVPVTNTCFCGNETYRGIIWDSMAENTTAIQRCALDVKVCRTNSVQGSSQVQYTGPRFNIKMTSYQYRKSHCGDKTILRPSYLYNGISYTAKAFRHCEASSTGCRWAEPDLRRCRSFSQNLTDISNKLKLLQLGYILTNTQDLYLDLSNYLEQVGGRRLMAFDFNTTLHLLIELADYARRFSALETASVLPQELVHAASDVFNEYNKSFQRYPADQSFGLGLLHLVDLLRMDPRLIVEDQTEQTQISAQGMDVAVTRLPDIPVTETTSVYHSEHVAVEVIHESVSSSARARRQLHYTEETTQVMVATFSNVLDFIPPVGQLSPDLELDSYLVSVGVAGADTDTDYNEDEVPLIRIHYKHLQERMSLLNKNGSVCVAWEFSHYPAGSWSSTLCNLELVQVFESTCICKTPGHFALAKSNYVPPSPVVEAPELDSAVLAGCSICLSSALITLVMRLILWGVCPNDCKYGRGIIIMNFCATLLLLHLIMLLGVNKIESPLTCRVITLLLAFFATASLGFLVLEALQMFLTNVHEFIELTPFKVTLGGWGLPLVILAVSVAFSEMYPIDHLLQRHCWLYVGEWQFYGMLVVACALLFCYGVLVMLLVCFLLGSLPLSDDKDNQHRKMRFLLFRSLVLIACLCVMLVLSVLMLHDRHIVHSAMFAVVAIILGLFLLTTHGILHLKKHGPTLRQHKEKMMARLTPTKESTVEGSVAKSGSTGSFKSFVRPFRSNEFSVVSQSTNYLQRGIPEPGRRQVYSHSVEAADQRQSLLVAGSRAASEAQLPSTCSSTRRPQSSTAPTTSQNTGSTEVNISDLECMESSTNENYKGRHNQNSLCSCSRCGSSFPFRPARGRSYISDSDTPLLSSLTNSRRLSDSVDIRFNKYHSSALYKKASPSHQTQGDGGATEQQQATSSTAPV